MNELNAQHRVEGGFPGRSPNELPPDSIDEEYNMPRLMHALTVNNSLGSELEESWVDLENKAYVITKQK